MCKECNKGVCTECAADVGGFLYCTAHAGSSVPEPEYPEAQHARAVSESPQKRHPASVPRKPAPPRKTVPRTRIHVPAVSLILPAVVGGIIGGMPSGIPFLNFLLLIWLFMGGFAATVLAILNEGSRLHARVGLRGRDGAIAGALSGFAAAFVAFTFSAFFGVNYWGGMLSLIVSLGLNQGIAEPLLKLVSVDPNLDVAWLALKLALSCIIMPVIGAAGGFAATRLFRN